MTRHRSVVLRFAAFIAFLIAVTVVGLLVPLPSVATLRSAIASGGFPGEAVFVVGYALLTLTPAPKSLLSVVAGVVGGFALGVVTVYLGALLGAAAAFVIGRQLGRGAVERFTGARIEAIDRAVTSRGFLAMLTLRLIPVVPFTALNYGAGLTGVRRRDYALATAVGIVPGDLAYVAVGAYGMQLGWGFWVAVLALAALSGAAVMLGIRLRRRAGFDRGGADPAAPEQEQRDV